MPSFSSRGWTLQPEFLSHDALQPWDSSSSVETVVHNGRCNLTTEPNICRRMRIWDNWILTPTRHCFFGKNICAFVQSPNFPWERGGRDNIFLTSSTFGESGTRHCQRQDTSHQTRWTMGLIQPASSCSGFLGRVLANTLLWDKCY